MSRYFRPVFLLLAICSVGCQPTQPSNVHRMPKDEKRLPKESLTYLQRRAKNPSQIVRTDFPKHSWLPTKVPEGVQEVFYPSGKLKLKGWLHLPEDRKKPHPALVYLHGGFQFRAEEYELCQPFIEAGYVVFCPTFRGKNGNPGNFELLYGEVEDAAAAVRWLAEQPYTDKKRLFVFGSEEGGSVAALLSLFDDVPAQHTGSYEGVITEEIFTNWAEEGMLPFAVGSDEEKRMRMLLTNLKDMKTPHYDFMSRWTSYHRLLKRANQELKMENRLLSLIPPDEIGITRPPQAVRKYLELIQTKQ